MVITGIGVVSPIGIEVGEYWRNLSARKPAFKPITLFDTKDLKVKVAGEITDFDPGKILEQRVSKDLDRATLLLSSATKLAITDAKCEINPNSIKNIGMSVGTTFGSLHSISEFDQESLREGPRYANPSIFPSVVVSSPASHTAILLHLKCFNTTISTGMCAGLDALSYACDFLYLDKAKTIVVGAVEDLCIQTFLGFYLLDYLAGLRTGSELLACPFDARRNGIIFSEGATALVLEEFKNAKQNNRKIYAEVLGFGSYFDPAKRYKYNPKGTGMIGAMERALKNAQVTPRDIDCIFANANSTQDADLIETNAIKKVFGDYAYEVPVTATKSILGETYSASGGMSLVASLGSLDSGFIPPTINLEKKDSRCDLNYVTDTLFKKELSRILINTFAPNGANTSVVVGKIS